MASRQAPIDLRDHPRRGVMPKRPAPNPATIVLAGLMLLTLAVALVMANNGNSPAPQADENENEIEFEPEPAEIVELTDGSAALKAEYLADVLGLESKGSEDIALTVSPNFTVGEEGKWIVQGFLPSTQSVDFAAGSGGGSEDCWFHIVHKVDYRVDGTFEDCEFCLTVNVKVVSSDVLSTDCPIGLANPEQKYMAPLPEELVFTSSPELKKSGVWTLTLSDVSLPTGIRCPGFSQ